jgi:phage-related protein
MLIALHGFIKKGRKTPAGDLALARQRLKELKTWREKTRT